MSGTERLISVDSHYRITVDQLKEAVPSRYRDAIDAANRRAEAQLTDGAPDNYLW